ncbi:MAG: AMP-binding protein, partial [Treponema sp.]|nr:AMP-binding protein [Treponema sp.]
QEIRGPDVAFLTDRATDAEDAVDIQEFLASPVSPGGLAALREDPVPSVDADETVIMMYTSGTTGKPKVVRQRLTEFENDNRFILSKYGEEFLKRKLCSTVSQHHIYGILFSILLPFTAAVPFRRRRIEFPEEFLRFSDTSYMIITVPAFLKRAVEQFGEADAGAAALSLKDPWIFTSGGAVPPETAKKTCDIFGFWPLEVYGSTETSGIAYRQSKNGMEWTPFDNARISKNADGCLVIRSPYIKDTAGFTTGDLVDILPDARFLLKGRADSIVKIEEKRISLPEVESRILQTGLVSDVCAVALEDRRQYLAAALALNSLGQERFLGKEKAEINRYFTEYLLQFFENTVIPKKWRYLEALPLDAQGKKKRLEIEALFAPRRESAVSQDAADPPAAGGETLFMHSISGMKEIRRETVLEQAGGQVLLEFSVPLESGYFRGHFPGYSILPGVAQLEMVMRLASRYFGTGIYISRFKRIKFSSIIRPGVPLHMKLVHNADKRELGFEIKSPGGDTVYSSGTVSLGEPE